MVHSAEDGSIPVEGEAPRRIQLSRAKGWRKPENTVSVARPGRWGNPFTIAAAVESGYATPDTAQAFVVECFRDWNSANRAERWWMGPESDFRRRPFVEDIGHLRGKNLACWCRLDQPCHADVLLEIANRSPIQHRYEAAGEVSPILKAKAQGEGG